jgi:hypothetical protein
VRDSVADGPIFNRSESAPAQPPERREQPLPASSEEEPSNGEATTQAEADDPTRPKRSGWWRRARATFVGE